MKTFYGTILIFAIAAAILLPASTAWSDCGKEHKWTCSPKAGQNPGSQNCPKRMMEEGRRHGPGRGMMEEGRRHGPGGRMKGADRRPGSGYGRKREGRRTRERETECLEWLKENYPEKAEKLAKLKEEKPKLYRKKMQSILDKYGRIAAMAKRNPKLAKVLKEDLELKQKRDKLGRKISAEEDKDKKKELIKELEEVISSRFDLIVKRKQIRYEHLLKRLKKFEEKVRKSEAKVEKWKDAKFKKENIKARLKELVSGAEKFSWQ